MGSVEETNHNKQIPFCLLLIYVSPNEVMSVPNKYLERIILELGKKEGLQEMFCHLVIDALYIRKKLMISFLNKHQQSGALRKFPCISKDKLGMEISFEVYKCFVLLAANLSPLGFSTFGQGR